jgi:hypothetical protein
MTATTQELARFLETNEGTVPEPVRDDLPRRRAVVERGRLRRWRRWTGERGACVVQNGATVAASHNVATIFRNGRVRAIDVAGALGVAPEQVVKMLVRNIGEQLAEGDLLAEQRLFFGQRRRRIVSPATGTFIYFSTTSGVAYVAGSATETQVYAHVGGQVVGVFADSVLVEGNAVSISGVAGAGRAVAGRLIVASTPTQIPMDLTGSIVACSFPLDETTARQLPTRGALGVLSSGIVPGAVSRLGWDDVLWPLTRPRFGSPSYDPAPPLTIVLLAVGEDACPAQIWERVASLNGRPVSLLGYEPGSAPELLATLDGPSGGMPPPVTVGGISTARVRNGPGAGRVVRVAGVLPYLVQLPSEVEVFAASIEIDGIGSRPVVASRHLQSLISEP